jgi:hypothetical protein
MTVFSIVGEDKVRIDALLLAFQPGFFAPALISMSSEWAPSKAPSAALPAPPVAALHAIRLTTDGVLDRHGISPRSAMSSSTCLSLKVSMAHQNPSYL